MLFDWYSLAWMVISLLTILVFLAAAVVALRKVGGAGAGVMLGGGLVHLLAWFAEIAPNLIHVPTTEAWWIFLQLGTWTMGSLLSAGGVLLLVLRAGGFRERSLSLEAIADGRGIIRDGKKS